MKNLSALWCWTSQQHDSRGLHHSCKSTHATQGTTFLHHIIYFLSTISSFQPIHTDSLTAFIAPRCDSRGAFWCAPKQRAEKWSQICGAIPVIIPPLERTDCSCARSREVYRVSPAVAVRRTQIIIRCRRNNTGAHPTRWKQYPHQQNYNVRFHPASTCMHTHVKMKNRQLLHYNYANNTPNSKLT